MTHTTFIPSDEVLIDYLDGKTTPEVSRQIKIYLDSHPEKNLQIKEWQELFSAYESMSLDEPPAHVLAHVLSQAHVLQNKTSPNAESWFQKFILGFKRREVILGTVLVSLMGLNFVTSQFESFNTRLANSQKNQLTPPAKTPSLANVSTSTADANATHAPATNPESNVTDLYERGLDAYQQGDFSRANVLFSDVMSKDSLFTKRLELYPYWIEALKKLGQYELAQKKLETFEKLKLKSSE